MGGRIWPGPGLRDTIVDVHALRTRWVGLGLSASLLTVPPAAAGMAEPGSVADHAPAAVVGLESNNVEIGARLTESLRRAFAGRGLSGGTEASLAELRLALGCNENRPACLARGGETLQARRLIYGTLQEVDGGWEIDISILEVESARVTAHESTTVSRAELAPDRIDQTAEEMVERLVPDTEAPTRPGTSLTPPPPPPPPPEPSRDEERPVDDEESGLVWGLQRPVPRWKAVGLGVSAGVFMGGALSYVGLHVWLNHGLQDDLRAEAQASLMDEKELNDVDPDGVVDICEYARSRPTDEQGNPLGNEGEVRNARITGLCNKGEDRARIANIMGVVGLVGLVSTVTFTTLLFVHREPAGKTARAWRERRMQAGLGSTPGRGPMLHLSGRF